MRKDSEVRANRAWRPEVERLVSGLGGDANGQPGWAASAGYQPQAAGYQGPQQYQAPPR